MGPAHYAAAVRVLGLAVAAAFLASCRCAAAGSGCMPELVSLSPCMDYMSGNASTPDGPCCTALSGMLRSSPGCLCTVVLGATPASLGVAVDGDRVSQLPVACKVQAPPASQCNGKPALVQLETDMIELTRVVRLCSHGSCNADTGRSGRAGAVRRRRDPCRCNASSGSKLKVAFNTTDQRMVKASF